MRKAPLALIMLVLPALLASCVSAPTQAPAGQASTVTGSGGLRVEVLARGLEHGWDIGFLPGGKLLVTERPGRLTLVDGGTVTRVAADLSDVYARGGCGRPGGSPRPSAAPPSSPGHGGVRSKAGSLWWR